MRISINDRLDKLENGAKLKNRVILAMVMIQPDGRYIFRLPEKLRDAGSFTEDDFDMLMEKYSINTLIIHDRKPKPTVDPPLTAGSWDEVFDGEGAEVYNDSVKNPEAVQGIRNVDNPAPPEPERKGLWPEW